MAKQKLKESNLMNQPKLLNYLLCIFFVGALAGCASPITGTLRQEAAPGFTFAMVFANPDAYQGDTVIWGGSIIQTINTKEGSSVYILQTSLGWRDRPESIRTSAGRFIATTDRMLDPLVFAKKQMVTVAGKVSGKKTVVNKKTGMSYTYPVVQIEQLYLWEKPQPLPPYYWGAYGPYWDYDPFWDYPYSDGFDRDEYEGHRFDGDRGEGRGEERGGDRDRDRR